MNTQIQIIEVEPGYSYVVERTESLEVPLANRSPSDRARILPRITGGITI